MAFSFLRKKEKSKRVLVVGIDGTPFTFLEKMMSEGRMPNFKKLTENGSLRQMRSALPTVSSVAWTSYNTGKNPAKHGIFGFIDKLPGSYDTYIPTAKHVAAKPVWQILSEAGKKVISINVPISYPPVPVNGILVSDFLTPDLKKGVYPESFFSVLDRIGYKIDIDTEKAHQSKENIPALFKETLERRKETLFHLYKNEQWDYLMVLFMETDRLHHFLWGEMEQADEKYLDSFLDCYTQVDKMIGEVADMLDDDVTLMIMSDHGFCELKEEIYINNWLIDQGLLVFDDKREIKLIDGRSKAFSLDPGRIYLNVVGREPKGCVQPGGEYEQLRDSLKQQLLELKDPGSGRLIIKEIFKKEEIYSGKCFDQAPDLILMPHDGFDIKGALNKDGLTGKQGLSGMHTYHDATFYLKGHEIAKEIVDITDILPTILKIINVDTSEDFDGSSLI